MPADKREYFRVEYPYGFRPELRLNEETYLVLDVSEHGVKFRVKDSALFRLGAAIQATVLFSDNEEYNCSGKITRLSHSVVVISPSKAIPLGRIRRENIMLLKQATEKST